MKLSKKVLSMVLCGFIVFGGSQATLVKANAQNPYNEKPDWEMGVRFALQSKCLGLIKDWWQVQLKYVNGHLILQGPTSIPSCLTFGDTFTLGWQKKGQSRVEHTVFRPCNGANAGAALGRAMDMFNKAHLEPGDKIFVNGQKYDYTLRFAESEKIIHANSFNNFWQGYQGVDRNKEAFVVQYNGLCETCLEHGNLY